jgi:hypothetical protein
LISDEIAREAEQPQRGRGAGFKPAPTFTDFFALFVFFAANESEILFCALGG